MKWDNYTVWRSLRILYKWLSKVNYKYKRRIYSPHEKPNQHWEVGLLHWSRCTRCWVYELVPFPSPLSPSACELNPLCWPPAALGKSLCRKKVMVKLPVQGWSIILLGTQPKENWIHNLHSWWLQPFHAMCCAGVTLATCAHFYITVCQCFF